eukprot:7677500-Ditylum_brightwellii.AAC.1
MRKNDLSFSVYHKKNQTIKYINRESCHRTAVFKAIPPGVFTRMGRLTSITDKNKDMPITTLYPTHPRRCFGKSKFTPKKNSHHT